MNKFRTADCDKTCAGAFTFAVDGKSGDGDQGRFFLEVFWVLNISCFVEVVGNGGQW